MKLSEDHVDEKLIGQFLFEGLSHNKIKATLLNGRFELIQVGVDPTSLISFPNGNLIWVQ